jgi:hypothetical protein
MFARWVDLGSPINYQETGGFGYTDDNQLPTIRISSPRKGSSGLSQGIRFGVADAQTGIDWATLEVSYHPVASDIPIVIPPASFSRDTAGIVRIVSPAGMVAGTDYIVNVSVKDMAGNLGVGSVRFTAVSDVQNAGVTGLGVKP